MYYAQLLAVYAELIKIAIRFASKDRIKLHDHNFEADSNFVVEESIQSIIVINSGLCDDQIV